MTCFSVSENGIVFSYRLLEIEIPVEMEVLLHLLPSAKTWNVKWKTGVVLCLAVSRPSVDLLRSRRNQVGRKRGREINRIVQS